MNRMCARHSQGQHSKEKKHNTLIIIYLVQDTIHETGKNWNTVTLIIQLKKSDIIPPHYDAAMMLNLEKCAKYIALDIHSIHKTLCLNSQSNTSTLTKQW